jgi:hypothetical protein
MAEGPLSQQREHACVPRDHLPQLIHPGPCDLGPEPVGRAAEGDDLEVGDGRAIVVAESAGDGSATTDGDGDRTGLVGGDGKGGEGLDDALANVGSGLKKVIGGELVPGTEVAGVGDADVIVARGHIGDDEAAVDERFEGIAQRSGFRGGWGIESWRKGNKGGAGKAGWPLDVREIDVAGNGAGTRLGECEGGKQDEKDEASHRITELAKCSKLPIPRTLTAPIKAVAEKSGGLNRSMQHHLMWR